MSAIQQITKDTNLVEFEAALDEVETIMKATGLPTDRNKLRENLLSRFAALHGVDAATADGLLKSNMPAPPPPAAPPVPVATAPVVEDEEPATLKRRPSKRAATAEAEEAVLPYFWVKPDDAAFIDLWVHLRKKKRRVANLIVTGPSGSGKTEGLIRAGLRHEVPVYKVDCGSITTADKWVGHKEVDATGTHFILSEHLRWLSGDGCPPGLLIYDEITRLHPSMHNILIPILDGSQSIWVPELNINVNVHPDTMFAATANIGAGYSGTYKMDDALNGRFGFRIEQTFPPEEDEVKVLVTRTGVDEGKARLLVQIASQTRVKVKTSDLGFAVATRNLLDTAELVAAGMSLMEAAEYTFIKMYSEDGGGDSERVLVKQIVAGKAAAR